jgi:glutamate racemase
MERNNTPYGNKNMYIILSMYKYATETTQPMDIKICISYCISICIATKRAIKKKVKYFVIII